jgi:phosphatidylglycerophosphate synthase
MTQDASIHRWTSIHSSILLVIGALILASAGTTVELALVAAAAVAGASSFGVLMGMQGRSGISIPNIISLLRLVLVLLAVLLLLTGEEPGYPVFVVLAAAGLSDLFDGIAARRLGGTGFGAKLDMELDAFFIYMLAVYAHVFYAREGWVLVAGLLRYGYVFVLLLLPEPDEFPRIVQLLSKGGCALAAIALIVVTAPLTGNQVRTMLSLFAVIVLCVSFFLDFVLRLVLRRDSG